MIDFSDIDIEEKKVISDKEVISDKNDIYFYVALRLLVAIIAFIVIYMTGAIEALQVPILILFLKLNNRWKLRI